MFCRKCGAEMEGGARFCPKCGLPVADASEEPSGEFGQAPDDADEAVEQLVSVEDEGEPTGSVAASPESSDGSSTGKAFGLESDSADADAEGDKGAANAGCTFDAEALATAATKRRDDAVAAKKAEEEAAKRAEEAKRARTIDTDYFTMVLPDWFPIDEFEYKTEERPDYGGGTGNWSVTNFIRNGDANDNADFMIVTYEQGMPGYGCGYAKELGSSKGRTVQLLVGGVTAQEALGMSLEDYGDALAACITLK